MNNIISFIDNYLNSKGQIEINAVEANALLARAGLLKDSKDRPGKPLRDILRKGKIPHAYQNGNRWVIPCLHVKDRLTPIYPQSFKRKSLSRNTAVNSVQNLKAADLLNDNLFKSAQGIDSMVPNMPGIYCIRITNPDQLPKSFKENLEGRKHDILYIGIATKSLRQRFLNQELRAIGHGTFFRSLGAMLGYRPAPGSLIGKGNSRNYRFSKSDTINIIMWINANLKVNWIATENNFEELENELIGKHFPLLNIAKNPLPFLELSQLRNECVRIANNAV